MAVGFDPKNIHAHIHAYIIYYYINTGIYMHTLYTHINILYRVPSGLPKKGGVFPPKMWDFKKFFKSCILHAYIGTYIHIQRCIHSYAYIMIYTYIPGIEFKDFILGFRLLFYVPH